VSRVPSSSSAPVRRRTTARRRRAAALAGLVLVAAIGQAGCVALIRHGARFVVETRGAHRSDPVDPTAVPGLAPWRKDDDAGLVATAADATLPPEPTLVIQPFEIERRAVEDEDDHRVAEEVQRTLHQRLLAAMDGAVAFARVHDGRSGEVPAGPDVLTLQGRISDLDLGNQPLRIVVGFGAGRTKLQVETRVVAADGRTLLATADRRIATKGWSRSKTFLLESAEDIAKGCAAHLRRWAAAAPQALPPPSS
jgi:hypothetical protein